LLWLKKNSILRWRKARLFLLDLFSQQIVGKSCGLFLTATWELMPSITKHHLNSSNTSTDSTGQLPLETLIGSTFSCLYSLQYFDSLCVIGDVTCEHGNIPRYTSSFRQTSNTSTVCFLWSYNLCVVFYLIGVIKLSTRVAVTNHGDLPLFVDNVDVVPIAGSSPTGVGLDEPNRLELAKFLAKAKSHSSGMNQMALSPSIDAVFLRTFDFAEYKQVALLLLFLQFVFLLYILLHQMLH